MELDYSIHGYPGHRGYPHFSTYISIICIEATYTWSEIYVVLYALLKWDLSVPFFVLFIQISFLSLLHYLVLLVHRIQATSVFLEHWLDIHSYLLSAPLPISETGFTEALLTATWLKTYIVIC